MGIVYFSSLVLFFVCMYLFGAHVELIVSAVLLCSCLIYGRPAGCTCSVHTPHISSRVPLNYLKYSQLYSIQMSRLGK